MTAVVIGYARVSTEDQNLDLQRDALERSGCGRIYEDKMSGARADRPGLAIALEVTRAGDQLVVWRLDRLGRSMTDLTETVQTLIRAMDAGQGSGAAAFAWKTVPQGAATSVWAAIAASADDVGRHYCEDCHVAKIDDDPDHSAGVRSYALDPERAQALWARSNEMVGEYL